MRAETGDKKLLTKQVNTDLSLRLSSLKNWSFGKCVFFFGGRELKYILLRKGLVCRLGFTLELACRNAKFLTKGKCLTVFCVCLFPVQGDSEVMSDPHLTMEYKLGLH